MTHDESERGVRLTIHNATKEQLKWMVKDRDSHIKRLERELKEAREETKQILKSTADLVWDITHKDENKTLVDS